MIIKIFKYDIRYFIKLTIIQTPIKFNVNIIKLNTQIKRLINLQDITILQ